MKNSQTLIRNIRKAMGMDIKSMAILMGMPYRTYQDKDLGTRPTTDAELVKARQLQDWDRELTAQVVSRTVDRTLAQHPVGIPSEKFLDND